MTDIGETAIDAIRSLVSESNAQVRYAGSNSDLDGTITTAICTGVENIRQRTEEGLTNAKEAIVRYKASAEVAAWGVKLEDDPASGTGKGNPAIMGQCVEILLPGDTDWDDAVKARVQNRIVMAGMVRLNVIGEFEEV